MCCWEIYERGRGIYSVGIVRVFGGFVESYILGVIWLEVGCRLGGRCSGGDI